jgi:hypothetical protein
MLGLQAGWLIGWLLIGELSEKMALSNVRQAASRIDHVPIEANQYEFPAVCYVQST